MGFDKSFNQDHCYLDDPADSVAMNVEIIEENYQIPQNNAILEKPVMRYYYCVFILVDISLIT